MSAEAALKIVDEVESKALSIVDQAKAVVVTDPQSYTVAGEMWKTIRDMMKEVAETFDPIIEANHRAHKKALEQKAKYYKPLEDAQKGIKQLMSKYDEEQERIRKAEEARLAEIARQEEERRRQEELAALEAERKAEEERLLQAALEAEAAGNTEQAEALVQVAEERNQETAQVAEQIQAEPVYVAPVVVPKATPKLAGGPVYRTVWEFEIVNPALIPREYLTPDEKKIGGVVRSTQGTVSIPGVRAYSRRV